MTREHAQRLLDKLNYAMYWTLKGGNSPEDHGSVVGAVESLGEIIVEVLEEISKNDEK